ncbi:phage tail tape measure protein [Vibrio europaeus]|uniref:phage tail tape measure protein n=1 Tax=Vibrio europaeus TaxID=300876 RepID=UPI00233EF2E3|nr:phage tail tape measure protein [Vibrio europaeus]MDC5862718.1 phage tail tape measure protein [Vibrio europaeus]MDC5864325.1 phage tail tape measure protein [Vibrio europaeus]MDC5864445.1 phage tail tape measure protein [Vibrio europaeus]MDC5865018.1 phage tail tape measure protein [Vibrio europaeus]
MAQKLETEITLNLAGNLAAKARHYGNSMGEFAKKNQKAMTLVKTTTAAAGRGIDALGNRYIGMAAAFATGAVAKGFVSLDRRLSRLSIAAEVSKDKAAELYDEIQRVSNLEGIRIDPSESLSAIEEILTKTGDLGYAMENLPNIATVIQATGAAGQQVGGIFTEFKKLAIEGSEAAMASIDVLNKQGKSGAFTLASMAEYGPQIFAAYAATGRQGAEAVTELGAALQVIRDGVGTDAQAVTVFESLIRDLTSPDRVKKLQQLGGISVFDQEKLKEGIEVMRPLPLIMEEIVNQSGGMSENLAMLNLTDEAKKAFNVLTALYKSTGSANAFDGFMSITGDGSVTLADAAVAAGDAAASLQLLGNSFDKFANQRLAEPIRELSDAINSIDDDTIQNWLKWGETAIWAVGGLVAAKKGLDIANAAGRFLGKGKGSSAGGKGGFQDLGAMPVFVVNMPGGGFGGGDIPGANNPTDKPTDKPTKNKLGRFFSLANLAKMTSVGYGLSIAPDFSPINVRRQSEVDRSQLPEGFPVSAGLMDVVDDFKKWFSSSPSNEGVVNNPYLSSNTGGNINVDVSVSDDRITTKVTSSSPTIKIDPDTGVN